MDAIEKKKLIASQAPLVDASKTTVFSALPVASTGTGAGVAVTAVTNIVTSNVNSNSGWWLICLKAAVFCMVLYVRKQ